MEQSVCSGITIEREQRTNFHIPIKTKTFPKEQNSLYSRTCCIKQSYSEINS